MIDRDAIDLLERSIMRIREAEREIEEILAGHGEGAAKAGKRLAEIPYKNKVETHKEKDAPAKRGRTKKVHADKPCCGSKGPRHLKTCRGEGVHPAYEKLRWKCIECGAIIEAETKPARCGKGKCENDLLTQVS